MQRRSFLSLAGSSLLAGALASAAARAEPGYPTSPIRLIVPYAPGGVVDAVARSWADKARDALGSVAVENSGGGGGTIGAATVARAAGDGYTLLFGDTSCIVIAPSLLKQPPYDPAADLEPLALVATSSTSIVVHPSVPCATLSEFVAYAKKNQQRLSYASAGTGTVTHLAGESFKQMIAAPAITHVPYRGAGPGLIDLIAGAVPMMTPNVTQQVLSFHRQGKLRILAVCAPARLKAAPEIPAANETLAGLIVQLTCGLFAPHSVPQPVAATVSAASEQIVQAQDFDARLEAAGLEPRAGAAAEARRFWAAERDHLIPIIHKAGLTPQ